MTLPVRNSIRILLLNPENELLLMCADDPGTTTEDGRNYGRYWFTIGGEIEKDESLEDAAKRELFEETGLENSAVIWGPIVWHGAFKLVLYGQLTELKQKFIVARTKERNVHLSNLTEEEQAIIKHLEWFSLEKMETCPEIIFPIGLSTYLPDIIAEKYPQTPLEVDLGLQP